MALPGATAIHEGPKGGTKAVVPKKERRDCVGNSTSKKNPFDVHPKNFKNYRLLREIYRSERD